MNNAKFMWVIYLLILPVFLFAQTLEEQKKHVKQNIDKIENTSTTTINQRSLNKIEDKLNDNLQLAKKKGEIEKAIEIERLLKELQDSIGLELNFDTSKTWYRANDIFISTKEEDNNKNRNPRWSTDVVIAGSSINEKAVSICSRSNGFLYAVYEDYGSTYTRLKVKFSTNGGASWNDLATLISNSEHLYFPCAVIGEGNYNKLFISFYTSNKEVYVASYDFNISTWKFVMVSSGDNIRPRICVDTDSYYYVYVAWIDEDWPSADDIYYSRSTDFGNNFSTPQKLLGGVKNNLDIGWGNHNLYIVYQTDSPGKIKLIKSDDPYGGSTWSSPVLISADNNKNNYPRIAVSDFDNKACVVYKKAYSPNDDDIKYSYTTNGSTWNINYNLSSSNRMETLPDIYFMPYSVSGNNFHVAYYDDGYIKYTNSDNLSSWSSRITISDNSNNSLDDFVSVCANSDNEGMVAWVYEYSTSDYDIHFDAEYFLTSVRIPNINMPSLFVLYQNSPNPFNPSTKIRFAIKERSKVKLVVFNVLGEHVATLVDKELTPGEYETTFSPVNLASGIYIYRLQANDFVQSRRMLFMK